VENDVDMINNQPAPTGEVAKNAIDVDKSQAPNEEPNDHMSDGTNPVVADAESDNSQIELIQLEAQPGTVEDQVKVEAHLGGD
jgi:hypothetical protein